MSGYNKVRFFFPWNIKPSTTSTKFMQINTMLLIFLINSFLGFWWQIIFLKYYDIWLRKVFSSSYEPRLESNRLILRKKCAFWQPCLKRWRFQEIWKRGFYDSEVSVVYQPFRVCQFKNWRHKLTKIYTFLHLQRTNLSK